MLSEDSLESQPETWRWFVSEKLGSVRLIDGFLKSQEDCVYPPENGSAWFWNGLHEYNRFRTEYCVAMAEFPGVRLFRFIK